MKNKLFSTDKIPQALIVRQAPLSNFDACLKEILKGIICPKHGCGECVWCKKIDNDQYFDLFIYEGKQMKKQEVIDLINKCNKSGIEACNIRVYVIKNIEYASKSILNSLLKFISRISVFPWMIFLIFGADNGLFFCNKQYKSKKTQTFWYIYPKKTFLFFLCYFMGYFSTYYTYICIYSIFNRFIITFCNCISIYIFIS